MARNHDDQKVIRQYLLAEISEDKRQPFEERLLVDKELSDLLEVAEADLIDEYLAGTLSTKQSEALEETFLAAPERQQQLRFAKIVHRNLAKTVPIPVPEDWFNCLRRGIQQNLLTRRVLVAASVILVIGLSGIWRLYVPQSEVDRSLIALNSAYSQQRPLESRITQLNYAPYVTTRGPGTSNVNEAERQRAEFILLEALKQNPTSAVHHALGKVYLAQHDFDRAIEQFEEALKSDPKNAQVYADLGAGWLEKGKPFIGRPQSKSVPNGSGTGLEELGRALHYLQKALELNPVSLEALFNRALCHEYLKLPLQAEEDWRRYLEKDAVSQWAVEARRRLTLLKEQRSSTPETKEALLRKFVDAYAIRDEEAAWAVMIRGRARAANLIIEALLDEFFDFALSGRGQEADQRLQIISYAGEVERKRVGDRFTSDLSSFYASANSVQHKWLANARAKLKLASTQFGKNEFEKAREAGLEAKELFAKAGDSPERLVAETWIGFSYLRMPRAEEAIQIFEPILKDFESRNYRSLMAQSLHALSDAVSSQNEFSKALAYAERGLEIAREIKDHATSVRCLGQCVSMHLTLGNYNESLGYFGQAINEANEILNEPKLIWPLYHEAALNFHLLHWPAPALAFEQEALRLAVASGAPLLRSRSWERLGLIYSRQQKHQEAIECGERALAEAQNVSSGSSQTNILARSTLILGELHREAGDPYKGIEYFDRALALYQDLDFDAYSYQAHKGKLQSLIALGEDNVADVELETVMGLFEDQRKKILEESNRNRFFDNGHDVFDLAIDFANSRRNNPRQAFAYAEASRARSLFEMIRTGTALTHDSKNRDIHLSAGSEPLSLKEIQAGLPDEVQLLEYAVLDDRILLWVVNRSEIKSTQILSSAKDLEQKTHSYVAALSRPSSSNRDAITQAAKELHSMLIAPAEAFLSKDRILCIIPDKALNYLPFEALMSASSGRYLIQDYKVQRSPSATIFIDSSRRATDRKLVKNEKLLSVGNPKFDAVVFGNLSDLPGARREARQIAVFYPAATTLVGEEATPTRVKRGFMEADVIHLATHAVANEKAPLQSMLLLTPERTASDMTSEADGVLKAADVYELRRPRARLVVLSACQTGIEKSYRGEGAIGFARPFVAAGVPLVVASLWPVDSEATAELMISFHSFRKQQNSSTVEALRKAQLKMIADHDSRSTTNYDWAAFSVTGGYATF